MTTPIEEAQAILASDPLPVDARARIGKLAKEIDGDEMDGIWEGLQRAEGTQGIYETGNVDLTQGET